MAGAIVLEKFKHASSVYIPPLTFNLLPERLNPSFDADVVDEWCIEFLGLKSSDVHRRRQLVGAKLGLISGLCYPTLPPNSLNLIAKFIAWLFLADDILEDPEICPSDKKNISMAYVKILKGEYKEAKSLIRSKEILRQMNMFHDLWEDLTSNMKMPARDRFINATEETLEMFHVESAWLHHKILPDVETYMWMRRTTSGVLPCFVAIDALQCLDLEDAADEPLIQKLEKLAIEHIALSNDVVSFRKEWVCGKYLNIVPIQAFHRNCSLDEAMMKAAKMVEDLEVEYTQVTAKINSSFELSTRKGVKEYVEGIGAWMKGNIEWGWMTERYHEQPPLNGSSGIMSSLLSHKE